MAAPYENPVLPDKLDSAASWNCEALLKLQDQGFFINTYKVKYMDIL